MKKEDHFTQTQLPLLSHTAAHGSRAPALGSHSTFSPILSCSSTALSHFALQVMPLFISFNDSSSCSFVNNGGHPLSMVGAVSFDISSCHQQPTIIAFFFL
jgi:hypothetical protein